jgi:hypothetical protein
MTNNTEPTLQTLQAKIEQLEESIKERENSLLRAIKTFVQDFLTFKAGGRDFPRAATLGLIFAYLRPRLVLALGGLAAVGLAGMQVWLLLSQNKLIEQQNVMIGNQARSNRMQAISAMLAGADEKDPSKLVLAQLSVYGEEGFDVLSALAASDFNAAFPFLLAGGRRHTGAQSARVVSMLVNEIGKEFEHDFGRDNRVSIINEETWRKAGPPNMQTEAMTQLSLKIIRYLNAAHRFGTFVPSKFESRMFVNAIGDIYLHYGPVITPTPGQGASAAYVTNIALSHVCARIRRPMTASFFDSFDIWASMARVLRQLEEPVFNGLDRELFVRIFLAERCSPADGPASLALPPQEDPLAERLLTLIRKENTLEAQAAAKGSISQ